MFDRKEEGRSGMVLEQSEQKQRVNLAPRAGDSGGGPGAVRPHLTKNGFFNELCMLCPAGGGINFTDSRKEKTDDPPAPGEPQNTEKAIPGRRLSQIPSLTRPKELEMKAVSYPSNIRPVQLSNRAVFSL